MLEVILNEKKVVKDALENKIIDIKPINTLRLLAKHYYLEGMLKKSVLKEQLLFFMEKNYKGYIRTNWETTVDSMVSKFLRGVTKFNMEVKLLEIEYVNVTKYELEKIKEIQNIPNTNDLTRKNLEKLAFIMLIYAKISNIQMSSNEGWINKSFSTILKEARVNLIGDERKRIFHKLYAAKFISQNISNQKTSIKINYINEESETVFKIDNFDSVIYYYMLWNDRNLIQCSNCGKPIKQTINNKKYCTSCSKEIKMELDRERMRENRKKSKAITPTNLLI